MKQVKMIEEPSIKEVSKEKWPKERYEVCMLIFDKIESFHIVVDSMNKCSTS